MTGYEIQSMIVVSRQSAMQNILLTTYQNESKFSKKRAFLQKNPWLFRTLISDCLCLRHFVGHFAAITLYPAAISLSV